jgi:hypothetical protein
MNKNQGLTVGAILLAGLIARSVSTNQTEIREAPRRASAAATRSAAPRESYAIGPWIASCNYWASVRPFLEDPDSSQFSSPKDASAKGEEACIGNQTLALKGIRNLFRGKVAPKGNQINRQFILDRDEGELGCRNTNGAMWGFPNDSSAITVTTIIATVPDPVHTHAAMGFDRAIAALVQAAQDNRTSYLSSYYWVPWKRYGIDDDGSSEGMEAEELEHDTEREHQPGLLVLKNSSGFNDVIYMFLVGESPTEGVNGFQLQNAFQYESDIRCQIEGRNGHFASGRDGHTSIIGPIYTGSAESLMAGIEFEAGNKDHQHDSSDIFEVSGSTSTKIAATALSSDRTRIRYNAFDPDGDYAQRLVLDQLNQSGYDLCAVAVLVESSTSRGEAAAAQYSVASPPDSKTLPSDSKPPPCGSKSLPTDSQTSPLGPNPLSSDSKPLPLVITFPREISLLRNAQEEREMEQSDSMGQKAPSPFLRLSLKDSNPTDSIPLFSRENTPLSQEAQLMAISRELHRFRVQYIAVVASNPLDQIFLAQFLRRACPDARLLFSTGGDLLMEREIDNLPFIGTTTVTSYPLISALDTSIFPDSQSEAEYNAASFALWDRDPSRPIPLKGYYPVTLRSDESMGLQQPFLWVTTVGIDGYYPLGILSLCASKRDDIAPAIGPEGDTYEPACSDRGAGFRFPKSTRTVYPSLLWDVICLCIIGLCFVHSLMLLIADYWSPLTRDLAIEQNVQPRRRCMYINVSVAMLFSMACVVALPTLAINFTVKVSRPALVLALATLGLGAVAAIISLLKIARFSGRAGKSSVGHPRLGWIERVHGAISDDICLCINVIAWATCSGAPLLWLYLCLQGQADSSSHEGVFFCYRCVNPGSGVSPLVPVLLLLLGWYAWALFQTRRLRLSEFERPRLPLASEVSADNRFFVSDESLCSTQGHIRYGLMRYASSLFITRESLRQALTDAPLRARYALDFVLLLLYLMGLTCFSVFDPIRSLNHLFWTHKHIADPFEILMGLLFFPLVVVALAGWLRTILMWAALRNGLLERLENQPIRLAFSRLKGFGWMGMLRQSGFHDQLRDIARSVESIRYVLHEEDIMTILSADEWNELNRANDSLVEAIDNLRKKLAAKEEDGLEGYKLVHGIEQKLSSIGRLLLTMLLVPYWQEKRTGLVDGGEVEELPMKARRWEMEGEIPNFPIRLRATPESADPAGVIAAQEFIALRYVALVRAVLANFRSLLVFISVAFVLCIVAWHSYPFQPRQQVDWLCTGLFFILGTGIVWVFVQMYRNPILNRITDTHPNELGWEFYLRILAFGAIPVLTWLAYQFPDIGNIVFKLFQPAIDVMK